MKPFLFLVGCARSGTTLLQRVVDAHSHVAVTPELHWLTGFFGDDKWLIPGEKVTQGLVAELMQHKRFRQFEFSREDFSALLPGGGPLPQQEFLEAFFGLYARQKNKPLVANKTPAYVHRIPALHGLWPEARFIHLIRDGRDVCLSVLNWNHAYRTAGRYITWAEDPVVTTALWWERKVRLGRQGGQALAPRLYCEIRYESLITGPAEVCDAMCGFLGLPYEQEMLRFHEGRTQHKPGLDAKNAWWPITPGLRDWRTQLPPLDTERFEATAGDLLDELGYPRAYPRPSAASRDHATRVREAFTRELSARMETIPQAWAVA
jgi:hypothetical protein